MPTVCVESMLFGKKKAEPCAPLAGRLHEYGPPTRSKRLRNASFEELIAELLARIHDDAFSTESTIALGCRIEDALRGALDIEGNRRSRQHQLDLFRGIYDGLGPLLFDVEDATIVDVGCGSINPFGLLFLFLMLGARRGVAIDLDVIQDMSKAVRTLADSAGTMLTAPGALVGDCFIRPEDVLRNIASFDLARMSTGDASGIDAVRLRYQQESISALTLQDGEADLAISHWFLEHVECVDEAIAELARITRHGGLGVHRIDGTDHRRYSRSDHHPLDFLTEPGGQAMVYGCNRIRPLDFVTLFEQHGFEVIAANPDERIDITPKLRDRLAEPFRSKPDEILGVLTMRLVVRRCDRPTKLTTLETEWRTEPVCNSHIDQAWTLINDARYTEALTGLLEIPESHREHYFAVALRGYVRYSMGDLEGAERDLGRAVALTERRPEAFLYRAWLRLAQKRIDDGARDALRAQELVHRGHRLETEVLDVLGLLYSQQGRHSEALQAFDRLLALQPDRPKLHVHRGWTLRTAGRRDEALTETEKALALDPGDEEAKRLKGLLLSDCV